MENVSVGMKVRLTDYSNVEGVVESINMEKLFPYRIRINKWNFADVCGDKIGEPLPPLQHIPIRRTERRISINELFRRAEADVPFEVINV